MADMEYDLSEITKGSEEAVRAIYVGTKKGISKSTTIIKRDAVRLCPVDTGRLRQSIAREVTDTDNGIVGVVGTNVEYAPYVEYGTGERGAASNPIFGEEEPVSHSAGVRGQVAQPFLRPAFYNNEQKVKDMIMRSIEEELLKMFPMNR